LALGMKSLQENSPSAVCVFEGGGLDAAGEGAVEGRAGAGFEIRWVCGAELPAQADVGASDRRLEGVLSSVTMRGGRGVVD
jgi:hypothetical protein